MTAPGRPLEPTRDWRYRWNKDMHIDLVHRVDRCKEVTDHLGTNLIVYDSRVRLEFAHDLETDLGAIFTQNDEVLPSRPSKKIKQLTQKFVVASFNRDGRCVNAMNHQSLEGAEMFLKTLKSKRWSILRAKR